MRVLITGAAGQLAGALMAEFERGHDVTALTHGDLDITDSRAVRTAFAGARSDVVINCAAYNDVDAAEDEAVQALQVNAFALRTLAEPAAAAGVVLVHYSSDFVFDGDAEKPYVEEDLPNPHSVYAASKLLGEWFAREAPRHYILRVESLFGGRLAKSSLDRIVGALIEGREVRVFVDRTVSPSYAVDVAAATRALIERGAPWGLYHCVNSGAATWHEVAREAQRQLGLEARLQPVSMTTVALRAERPRFSALSNQKLASVGISMPTWQDALARYLAVRTGAAARTAGFSSAQ